MPRVRSTNAGLLEEEQKEPKHLKEEGPGSSSRRQAAVQLSAAGFASRAGTDSAGELKGQTFHGRLAHVFQLGVECVPFGLGRRLGNIEDASFGFVGSSSSIVTKLVRRRGTAEEPD